MFVAKDKLHEISKENQELSRVWAHALAELSDSPYKSQAKSFLENNGLPDKHLESWLYTNPVPGLHSIKTIFPESKNIKPLAAQEKILSGYYGLGIVDGCLVQQLLPGQTSAKKISHKGVQDFLTQNLEEHAPQMLQNATDALHLLRNDGENIILSVRDSVLYNINIAETGQVERGISATQLYIHVAKDVQADILITLSSIKEMGLDLLKIIVVCEENTKLFISLADKDATARVSLLDWRIFAKRNSQVEAHYFTPGGLPARTEIDVHLIGEGAGVNLQGLYLLNQSLHADIHTSMHHKMPHTESQQLFKAIAQDSSQGIYTGKVIIYPKAKGSSAKQLAKGLLLSKKAHFTTRPQLEVYNDDVKCGHGAAVGQINQEELFYLEARGLSPLLARKILLQAFLHEILASIKNPLVLMEFQRIIEQYSKVLSTSKEET